LALRWVYAARMTSGETRLSFLRDCCSRNRHHVLRYFMCPPKGAAWGLRKLLNWVHRRYSGPEIIVTEGGWSLAADTAAEAQTDTQRVAYYANYTSEMLKAIHEDGINVSGYFAWSLMDNFEWEKGYSERFGVIFTDFGFDDAGQPTVNQSRTLKDSACWFSKVWAANAVVDPADSGCDLPQTREV